jgi:hypothetical protein
MSAASEAHHYRRKDRTVLAQQYDGLPPEQTSCQGVCRKVNALHEGCPKEAHVHTLHSNQAVIIVKGDWVVQEQDGEHYYPIKPNVFTEMHHLQPVTDPGA